MAPPKKIGRNRDFNSEKLSSYNKFSDDFSFTPPNLYREDLLSWYHKNIEKNQSESSYLKLKLNLVYYYFLFSVIISFIVTIFQFTPRNIDEMSYFIVIPNFIAIIISSYILIQINYFTKRGLRNFRYMVEKKTFIRLEDKNLDIIDPIFWEIARDMEVDYSEVQFWRSNSKTYLPSIVEDEKLINVVLPMNFFLLCLKEPNEAKALIAHEFGHVIQKDTNYWLYVDFFANGLRKYLYPYMRVVLWFQGTILSLNLLITITMGLNTNNFSEEAIVQVLVQLVAVLIIVRITNFLKGAPAKVKACRLASEELADTASIIYSDGKSMIAVLNKYAQNSIDDILHPAKEERIKYMLNRIKKYQI
ncbi:MAG: M48 family metalloprotease [Saprospiraceae bacterium]